MEIGSKMAFVKNLLFRMYNKLFAVSGLVIIILGMVGYFLVLLTKNENVMTRVGKLMVLPDEMPKIAQVTDSSKLESQKFFKNANNGDIVLIFTNASKAVLYRSQINKIIDVATVLPIMTEEPTPTVVKKLNITVALYNGTNVSGLTDIYEKEIVGKYDNIVIESKEKATRNDFADTIVVDVNNKDSVLTAELATMLGASVSPLPDGETKPEVDLIIILGKNSVK